MPRAVAFDLHPQHLLPGRLQALAHRAPGGQRDLVLGRASSGEHRHPQGGLGAALPGGAGVGVAAGGVVVVVVVGGVVVVVVGVVGVVSVAMPIQIVTVAPLRACAPADGLCLQHLADPRRFARRFGDGLRP